MGRSADGVFRLLKLKNVGAARASLAGAYPMRGQTVGPVNCAVIAFMDPEDRTSLVERVPSKRKRDKELRQGVEEGPEQGIDS